LKMSNPNVQGQRQSRLVLHFDINNTILMKDPAKGLNSVQMNVARIVCKCAWGKVTPPNESDASELPVWTFVHDQLSWSRPAQA